MRARSSSTATCCSTAPGRRAAVSVGPHRRGVGVVFQDSRLLPHYSVRGNLQYGLSLAPRSRRRFGIDDVAGLLGIEHLLDRSVALLSGGEIKRIAIGRAILAAPRLLLLDEPLAGVDSHRKREILPFLRDVRERTGIPTLFVSHDMTDLLSVGNELLLMEAGKAVGQGRWLDLLDNPRALHLMHEQGLVNALPTRVTRYEQAAGMTVLTVQPARPGDEKTAPAEPAAAEVCVKGPPRPDLACGEQTCAVIAPDDIALALAPIEHISMQNQFAGTIVRKLETDGRTLCLIDVGVNLLVEVTQQAVANMHLHVGKRVWVFFKANAVRLLQTGRASNAASGPATPAAERGAALADEPAEPNQAPTSDVR